MTDNGPIAQGEPFYKRSSEKSANQSKEICIAPQVAGESHGRTQVGYKRIYTAEIAKTGLNN